MNKLRLLVPLSAPILVLAFVSCRGPNPNNQAGAQATYAQPTLPAPPGAVPAGTRLMVRTSELIDSRRQGAGARFTAKLEADLLGNDGKVVAPHGADVYGQLTQARQAGRLVGRSEMTIVLTDLMIDNQLRPLRTTAVQASTESSGKGTVGRIGAGAAIGGIAGGSDGARTGAAIGAAAAVLTRGDQISIPPGSLLEFMLDDHLVVAAPSPAPTPAEAAPNAADTAPTGPDGDK